MIPAARLWAALCLLSLPAMIAGLSRGHWQPLLIADGALLALAILDAAIARSAKLTVRRELPARLSVAIGARVELHLVHSGNRTLRVLLKDDLPPEISADPMPLSLEVPPRAHFQAQYLATAKKRGAFELGDLHLRVRGPLGLTWHERTIPAAHRASVFPDLRFARKLLLASGALDLSALGVRQLPRDGRGSEFARLRDYTQGDSAREVEWKATARRGRPVTRVMEAERSQTVIVCVDAGRAMARTIGVASGTGDASAGLTKLDHAVNAALLLAFIAIRSGDRVGLVVFADDVQRFLPAASGRLQYRRIVDALYATRPQLTYVDYGALFRQLSTRVVRRAMVCLFTDLLEVEQASMLSEPLRRLAHRHVPVCLSTKDIALEALLSTMPADGEDAFRHAAASERLIEREQMKAAIARDGVHLIDVDPEALALAAVNRYVEVKSRGLL